MRLLFFFAIGVMSLVLTFTREHIETKLDWYVVNGKLQRRVVRCDGGEGQTQ